MARVVRRLGVVLSLLSLPTAELFAQPDRIKLPIDRNRTAALTGNVHWNAQAQYDQGPVEPSFELGYVTLTLKRAAGQQAALERLLAEQQSPSSANFHKWLTPEQFGDRFGPSPGDTAKIVSWLRAEGFTVSEVGRSRHWIAFHGTAGEAARAFGARIHRYTVDGATRFANSATLSIPEALADVVAGFDGLDDFPLPSMMRVASPDYNIGGQHYLAPDDLATIYNITPLHTGGVNGSGQKIAIVGQGSINVADIQAFRSRFHLPPRDPQTVLVGPDPGNGGFEPYLDIEWAGAVAPNADIVYVYGRNANNAAQFAIDHNLAPVISESYGNCEPQALPTLRSIAQQANAQGITWLAASGDSGAAGCDRGLHPQATRGLAVSFPASLPEVTAVGGSQFNEVGGNFWGNANRFDNGSAQSYIPETVWNENDNSGLSAGGGGASVLFPKPAWQTGPGVPNNNARNVPDVALSSAGHDGYWVVAGGLNVIAFGTSAATPSFAGIIALLNQYVLANGYQTQPGLGNINPALYRLSQSAPGVFHDITDGDNVVPCMQNSPDCAAGSFGYAAGPGYDLATGLGSVDANNLITQWNTRTAATVTTLASDSNRVNLGRSLRLTAAVSAAAGAPTGSVSFNVGDTSLGVVPLAASGKSMMATLAVSTSRLPYGADTITAIYGGDRVFDGSSASITVVVGLPIGSSAVIPSITPNPVFRSAIANSWAYTVKLTEAAGVPTVLTDYTINGVSHLDELIQAFVGSTLPAYGSLSAELTLADVNTAAPVAFGFSGLDASGAQWSQQLSVPFFGPALVSVVGLGLRPQTMLQDPGADESCQWSQQVNVQERNGFALQLIGLFEGTNDLTNQIQQIFGTTHIAAFGGVSGKLCWTGITAPQSSTLEIDVAVESGGLIKFTASPAFRGPASSVISMSADPAQVTLSADGDQTAAANVDLGFTESAAEPWSLAVFPANRTTSWLTVSPLSGTGPAQLSIQTSAVGLARGVYTATLIILSGNATPAYLNIPVVFVVGASPDANISSIANAASPDGGFAPGEMISIAGSGLASDVSSAKGVPLGLRMSGVSATVNGVSAPLYSISPELLKIQIPYETGGGTAILGVNNNGRVSAYSFQVAASAPAIFTAADGSLAPSASGSRGQTLTLSITGEGELLPALADGISPLPGTPVTRLPKPRLPMAVTIGGVPATIQSAGVAAGSVGVTQISFTIPQTAPLGSQPVVVAVGGVASPPANLTVGP